MADRLVGGARQRQVLDELVALSALVGLGFEMLVHAAFVQRVGVEQTGLRVERRVLPVLRAARRGPVLGRLHLADALRDLRLDRASGLHVDMACPIDLLVGLRRNEFARGAVEDVQEAVAVELHRHLAHLAVHLQLGEDQLPAGVVVVRVVRRELVVPDDLAGLRPQREHRGGVEVVARAALRGPRRGIADAPVHEIELRIIGPGDPRRAAPDLPGIVVLWPGVVALLAARGNRIAAPELLAAVGVIAVDEAAHAELGAGIADDQHAVGDERRERQGYAVLPFRHLGLPQFLAGLGVEREHVRIERRAIDAPVVERGALVGDAAAHDAGRIGRPVERVLPELLAAADIDRHGVACIGHVHHAVVDDRLRLLAPVIVQAQAPHRHQALDGSRVDLVERAIALLVIAHPVRQDVVGLQGII